MARETLRQRLVLYLPTGWLFPAFFVALHRSKFLSGINFFLLKDSLERVLAFVLAYSQVTWDQWDPFEAAFKPFPEQPVSRTLGTFPDVLCKLALSTQAGGNASYSQPGVNPRSLCRAVLSQWFEGTPLWISRVAASVPPPVHACMLSPSLIYKSSKKIKIVILTYIQGLE